MNNNDILRVIAYLEDIKGALRETCHVDCEIDVSLRKNNIMIRAAFEQKEKLKIATFNFSKIKPSLANFNYQEHILNELILKIRSG